MPIQDGTEISVRKRKMIKKVEELTQSKKTHSPEVKEFFKEVSEEFRSLGIKIQEQLEDAERELENRRRLGEDI